MVGLLYNKIIAQLVNFNNLYNNIIAMNLSLWPKDYFN